MRRLVVLLCALGVVAIAASLAWAGAPTSGNLSVDRGRGVVMIDLRGSVLGRLTTGSLKVTDQTPNDPYTPLVAGKKLTWERLGPRTVIYRGLGLRFRLVGGSYRITARGSGITVSAVGRGTVMLDGEPRWPGDDIGLYSRDGSDCSAEAASCLPLPEDPERFTLEQPSTAPPGGAS